MANANALQLESVRATPAVSRFSYYVMPSLKSLNLSMHCHFCCWYITLAFPTNVRRPDNSARDCSNSLKFRTDFDDRSLNVPRTLKVNGSQRNITYQRENAIIQARISCRRSNSVKIISEPSATRYTAFKVIRSNIEIAITPLRIARIDCVQLWYMVSLRHKRYTANVQGQSSKVKVTA